MEDANRRRHARSRRIRAFLAWYAWVSDGALARRGSDVRPGRWLSTSPRACADLMPVLNYIGLELGAAEALTGWKAKLTARDIDRHVGSRKERFERGG